MLLGWLSLRFRQSGFSGCRTLKQTGLEAAGGSSKGGDDIRIETIPKERKKLVADTIAGVARVAVALIDTEFEGTSVQVLQDILPTEGEQRSDMMTVLREHTCHAHRSGTADEIHEKSLSLVIHVVPESDGIKTVLFSLCFKKSVPEVSERIFIAETSSRIVFDKTGDPIRER